MTTTYYQSGPTFYKLEVGDNVLDYKLVDGAWVSANDVLIGWLVLGNNDDLIKVDNVPIIKFNENHDEKGRFDFGDSSTEAPSWVSGSLAALKPVPVENTLGSELEILRNKTGNTMMQTPEGDRLVQTVSAWQSSGANERITNDIQDHINGNTDENGATNLLTAINNSPTDTTLYRGINVEGKSGGELLGEYKPGSEVNIAAGSFSSSRVVGEQFAGPLTLNGDFRSTPVIFKTEGSIHALPVQNLSGVYRLWREQEWITSGKYQVVDSFIDGKYNVNVTLKEVGTFK